MTPLIKIPGFIDDVASGMVANDLAEKYSCLAASVRYAAKKNGLALTHARRGPPRGTTFDYNDVVCMREGGATYLAVGNSFGVSRERVRQILHLEGRSDLCFRKPKLPRGQCLNCGAPLDDTRNPTQKNCNQKCFSEYAAKTLTQLERRIIEASFQGRAETPPATWLEIARRIGYPDHMSTGLPTRFKTYCAKIGLDHTVAFHNKKRAA